jgi:hypothetical protein
MTLAQEILQVLWTCQEGLSRDALYTCGRLSAPHPATLLIALQELVAEDLVRHLEPGEFGSRYQLTWKGKLRAIRERDQAQPSVTEEARATVREDRIHQYGHPLDFCETVAGHWSVLFGHDVSAEQVALAMLHFKVAREAHRAKRDNRVDIAGYAEVLDMIHRERELRAAQNATIAVAA